MNDIKIGDKVLRKSERDGYRMGTIERIAGERATVAWASNRLGGDGTQRSQIKLSALVATTEEECRQRAKEAAAARKAENERRWPYRCENGHSADAVTGRSGKPCYYCGGKLSIQPGREAYA